MQESFLHYIWQFQYFDKKDLKTSQGDEIDIFKPGLLNGDSGADFSNSKVRIGEMEWVGSIEIHTKSSSWYDHHHDSDPAYENVILHVVWNEDKPVHRQDGTPLPTLVLENRVDEKLIERYRTLISSPSSIPCEKQFKSVEDLIVHSMLDKSLSQRLETKAGQIHRLLSGVKNDWEAVTYQLMARNFGFKINWEPFLQLANSVRRNILLKHSDNLTQVEALLFGQAGFLDYGIKDEYFKLLKREYKILSSKYGLENQKVNSESWKFLRLRPANFPTIRIAQFSALFCKNKDFFSKLIEADSPQALISVFDISTSEYWHHHYRFGRKTARSISKLGLDSINNVIINTIAPILVAYGKSQDNQDYVDKAILHLHAVDAEKNKITKAWGEIGLTVKDAFDSQAIIELNNNYCIKRRCLSCNIGNTILKPVAK